MNSHLPTRIQSLSNWTDQLLEDAKILKTVNAFKISTNTKDYLAYYKCLLPFSNQIADIKNELAPNLIEDFNSNYNDLIAELSKYTFKIFFTINLDSFFDRSLDEAVLILSSISNNCKNIIYQFTIHCD